MQCSSGRWLSSGGIIGHGAYSGGERASDSVHRDGVGQIAIQQGKWPSRMCLGLMFADENYTGYLEACDTPVEERAID
jgi:hypothetical protein